MKTTSAQLIGLWDDVDLRVYLGEVKRRHGVVEVLALPSMHDLPPIQIETLFVQPQVSTEPVSADNDPTTWPSGDTLLSELQKFGQLVVLGDPGGGKTTLSNWLAWRLSSGLTTPLPEYLDNRVPLPCILRDIHASVFSEDFSISDLACYISKQLLGEKSSEKLEASLRKRVEAGEYVLILDGVDEIPLENRYVVSNWMRIAHGQNACVLATSRIVGYEDGPVDRPAKNISVEDANKKLVDFKSSVELVSSHIIKKGRPYGSGYKSLDMNFDSYRWAQIRYLMPFDQNKIALFSENWYRQRCHTEQEARQRTTDLLVSLSQSEVTQKLARTPNLLSLMAIVHRERAHLPDGKALLYDEIVNAYINTIDKQRKIDPGDALAPYTWKERKSWLAYVGFKMQQLRGTSGVQERNSGVLVDESSVEAWLTEALMVSGVASASTAAKTFLSWVARRSGLLLPRGEGKYAFVHLSFQEYFCACYLESCIVRPAFIRNKLSKDEVVTRESLASWGEYYAWLETFVFLFELISAERGADWVEDLASIMFDSQSEFDSNIAELAARLLKNKHIRLDEFWRDRLADGCSVIALREWEHLGMSSSSTVLLSLVAQGYAHVVSQPREEEGEDQAIDKYTSSVAGIFSPEKVRVLIVCQSSENFLGVDSSILFSSLKCLVLDGGNVADLSRIKFSKGLRVLKLRDLPVQEISPIASLKNLEELEVDGLALSDLSAISSLKKLSSLELSGMDVGDLTSVSLLKKINSLTVRRMPVANLDFLSTVKKLGYLVLDTVEVCDLSGLVSIGKLGGLTLEKLPLKSIESLRGMKRIERLCLEDLEITSLSGIESISIEGLVVSRCSIVDFSDVQEATLRSLMLDTVPVNGLKFVSRFKNLFSLHLLNLNVDDVSPLQKLNNLRILTISDLEVSDVSPLSKLSQLRYLEICSKSVSDVSSLVSLSSLRHLDLTGSSVKDYSMLESTVGLNIAMH